MNTFTLKTRITYFLLLISGLMMSCSDDDPQPEEQPSIYDGGVFITNEGGFGSSDGSLSFYSETGVVTSDVFSAANPGENLGDVVQSSWISDSLLFVVVNNSNKIEVLNLNDSLKLVYTLDEVSFPRYMTTSGALGYVAEWVSFTDPGRLTIFDIETGEVEKTITTDFGAERVLISGGKIFVSNNFSNTVSIIGLESEVLIQNLEVGNSPAGLFEDADGDVWVLCAGGYDENFTPLNDGKLVELVVSTESVKKEIELGQNVSGELQASPEGTILYYYTSTSVYSVATSATEAPANALITEANALGFYGLGVGKDGKIYAADAKDFVQSGEVFVYDEAGVFETKFTVGRNPNGFAFN